MNTSKSTIWALALIVLLAGFSSCKGKKALADKGKSDPTTTTETSKVEEEEEKAIPVEPVKADPPKSTTSVAERLNTYFESIAGAPSLTSANNNIKEATSLFSSPDVPVLIIFYAANGQEEFEEPTTISKYLNYVKDVKKNTNVVSEYVTDPQGKIKEIVLVRKKY